MLNKLFIHYNMPLIVTKFTFLSLHKTNIAVSSEHFRIL